MNKNNFAILIILYLGIEDNSEANKNCQDIKIYKKGRAIGTKYLKYDQPLAKGINKEDKKNRVESKAKSLLKLLFFVEHIQSVKPTRSRRSEK